MASKKKFLLNKNVNIITLNSTIAEQIKEWCPEIKNKIFTIPNPVNTKEYYPMSFSNIEKLIDIRISKPIILFLGGTGDPRKGWDLLQKSLSLCTSSFDLLMIGEPSVTTYGKSGQINIKTFPQIKNSTKLCALYSLATVVVVPSRFEGLPQVATEALCCGTPIVGFDIAGIKDIIVDHKNGILVPKFDVDKFAKAIDCIITNKKDSYEGFCREYALSKFSFDTIGSAYKKVIIQVQKLI
jgi:glycosyltransferase involved in cell wall biosynthesis